MLIDANMAPILFKTSYESQISGVEGYMTPCVKHVIENIFMGYNSMSQRTQKHLVELYDLDVSIRVFQS